MKYKINNHIIDAKSPTEALKVHKLVSKVKDAEPINVENIPYKNDKYVVLEFTHNGNKKYFVVAKENYHNEKRYTGGGILEYDLSSAKKTADDFLKMNGKSYKEWIHGDSINDTKTVKIKELKKGDKFKDPYYNNEECVIEGISSSYGDYKVKSLKTGSYFWVSGNKRVLIDSVKDDESLQEKIHKAQEWVDFDIKHHGEVSELTKRDIEKMGLKFNKWDNQVTDSVKDIDLPRKGDKYTDKRYSYVIKSIYAPFGKLSVIDLTREDGKDFTVEANEFERHFRKINDSINDSKIVKLEELKKGDKFKDPYGDNKEYIVEKIDLGSDGDYEVKSIKSGIKATFRRDKRVLIDSINDSNNYVIYKEGSYIYGTNEDNYNRRIQNEREIQNFTRQGFDNIKEVVEYMKKYGHVPGQIIVKDSDDIDYLSQEEEQAIEDYKKAIMNTNDVKLLKLFAHILKEETEHLEELQNEEVEDSVNDSIEIKVSLEGKTYKGHYTGKSNKYDDMGEVFISELADYNNEKNTPKDDVGFYPKDGKYYISMKHILKDNPYLKMFK